MRCADCKHSVATSPRWIGLDPGYRHCALKPGGVPVLAWVGVTCHWTPPKWEERK